jgi:hypothetical protein
MAGSHFLSVKKSKTFAALGTEGRRVKTKFDKAGKKRKIKSNGTRIKSDLSWIYADKP